jgi:hypothetical protein
MGDATVKRFVRVSSRLRPRDEMQPFSCPCGAAKVFYQGVRVAVQTPVGFDGDVVSQGGRA